MTRLLRHAQRNAVAYLALFVALGGTSYAALRLPAGSVGTRALKNHSVTADKLARGSIAGYVRDYATVNSLGQITASRPRAHIIVWRTSGFAPGGTIAWSRPIPASCFALATTQVSGSGTAAAASAQIASGGTKHDALTYVLTSDPSRTMTVAVVCPQ